MTARMLAHLHPLVSIDMTSCGVNVQEYLKKLTDRIVVVVSHDRAFLDAVAQEIILLRNKRLTYHSGGDYLGHYPSA